MKIYFVPIIAAVSHVSIAQGGNYWTQKASFPGTARMYAVGFSIGQKGYIGTGLDINLTKRNDFWEYDPTTNTWTQKANMPDIGRDRAVGFSIGSKGYVGTGENGTVGLDDFWEYDQGSNSWSQKANFGGGIRGTAFGLSIGTKGYIGSGGPDDFWEYDPFLDSWSQKATFTGLPRYWAVAFSINNKGYVGTGMDTSNPNPPFKRDFWEYDYLTNVWSQKPDLPGFPRFGASGFSISGKGYIGIGQDSTGFYTNDFYEYNQSTNTWVQRTNFGGTSRFQAVSFSIGNKGYIGTGYDGFPDVTNTFWEYTPDSITSIENFEMKNISVFPNPSTGLIQILFLEDVQKLRIYNLWGKIIEEQSNTPSNQSLTLDISTQSEGVYYIHYTNTMGTSYIHKVLLLK